MSFRGDEIDLKRRATRRSPFDKKVKTSAELVDVQAPQLANHQADPCDPRYGMGLGMVGEKGHQAFHNGKFMHHMALWFLSCDPRGPMAVIMRVTVLGAGQAVGGEAAP